MNSKILESKSFQKKVASMSAPAILTGAGLAGILIARSAAKRRKKKSKPTSGMIQISPGTYLTA
jgi:hypothetical protein